MFTGMFFIFVVPLVVATIAPFFLLDWGAKRLGPGIGIFFLGAFLSLCAPGGGTVMYSHGFHAGTRTRLDLDDLQTWAVSALNDYRSGTLAINTNHHRWAFMSDRIDDDAIPEQLKKAWSPPPCVGIVAIADNGYVIHTRRQWEAEAPDAPYPNNTTNCVMISWYLHGLLVGPKDFKSAWNPYYLEQIKPGIYVWHAMK